MKDAGRLLMGLAEMLNPMNLFHPEKLKEGFRDVKGVINGMAKDMSDALKTGTQEGIDSWANSQVKMAKGLVPAKTGDGKAGLQGPPGKAIAEPKTKAEGHKSVNIHVNIKELVHEIKIVSTTIKGSITNIKDEMSAALVSVVNDSQILAHG